MKDILKKELTLSASVLSYLFILFSFMFFIPGYPILCGVFFVTLGIFQSFQNAREANDIVFSSLLPIAKKDVVKGKFVFSCFIEVCSISIMAVVTIIRMTILKDAIAYKSNTMMNANLFALGIALIIFSIFNLIFVGGFFKTAYKFAKTFVTHIIVTFIIIGISETLHHIPSLKALNAFGFEFFSLQLCLFCISAAVYIVITYLSYKCACKNFERIDL